MKPRVEKPNKPGGHERQASRDHMAISGKILEKLFENIYFRLNVNKCECKNDEWKYSDTGQSRKEQRLFHVCTPPGGINHHPVIKLL